MTSFFVPLLVWSHFQLLAVSETPEGSSSAVSIPPPSQLLKVFVSDSPNVARAAASRSADTLIAAPPADENIVVAVGPDAF